MPEPGPYRPHLMDEKGLVHRISLEPTHTTPGRTVCDDTFTRHASYAEPWPRGIVRHMRAVDDVPTCVLCVVS